MGVGTFYSHFEDKHALHRSLVRRAYDLLQGRLGAAVAGEGATIPEQVLASVTVMVDFAAEYPDLFRVAFGRPAPQATPGEPALAFSTRAVEQRLSGLQRAGQIDPHLDPRVAARGFLALQTGVVLQWMDGRLDVSREVVIDSLTRMHPALSGIGVART